VTDKLFNAIAIAIAALVVIAIIGGSIWFRASVPCKYVDWMPAKEVPTRCLIQR
jgi:hypothetical protein